MNFNELLFDKKNPGEHELTWFLRNHGYIVDDVSGEPAYWNKDIDLLITSILGEDEVISIEVKWDKYIAATGNLFIELENPRSICGIGWFNFCEAEYLAYGDARNRIFYFIKKNTKENYYILYILFLSFSSPSYNIFCILLLYILMNLENLEPHEKVELPESVRNPLLLERKDDTQLDKAIEVLKGM